MTCFKIYFPANDQVIPGGWRRFFTGLFVLFMCLVDSRYANAQFPEESKFAQYGKDAMDSADMYEKTIALLQKENNKETLMSYMWHYGLFQQRHADFDNARQLFEQLYHASSTGNLISWQSKAALQLGNIYFIKGNEDSSLYYYYRSASLGEQVKSDSIVSLAYQSLGGYYKTKKKFELSHQFLDKAIQHARLSEDDMLIISALVNKAMTYSWQEKPDEAIALHQQVLPMAERMNNQYVTGYIHMNLAACYVLKKDVANVRRYLDLLQQDLAASAYSLFFQCEVYMVSGFIYRDINKPELAEQYILKAIPIGRQIRYKSMLQRGYDTLSLIRKEAGDYKNALQYYQLAQLYKDSIANEKSAKVVSELEVKYQTAQKEKALTEKQVQIMQKDLALQKSNRYTFYSIGVAVIAILIAGFIYYNLRNRKWLHQRQLTMMNQEKEIHLLQALMQGEEKERNRIAKDLHDGVAGMLAAVKMHFESISVQIENVNEAKGYQQGIKLLDEASHEVRKTSHNLMPEVLLQHGLDAALLRYCSSISNVHSMIIEYDSLGTINRFAESFELSVYRIVQELINNIIRHSKATRAIVQVSQRADILSIAIEDNGVGFDTTIEDHDGMGIKSLKSRIKAMNGKMELDSSPNNGVSIFLEFEITNLDNLRLSS